MSYYRRFKRNTLFAEQMSSPIRVSEINEITICIIKQIQHVNFGREINDLKNSRSVHSKSTLLRLKPCNSGGWSTH